MTVAFFRIIKSIKFQLIAMLVAACYIALVFVIHYKKTIIDEKPPYLLQIDNKIKQLATPVTVGIHINGFPEFSFATNNFIIDATVWFRFAKATESLETLSKFTIQNSKLLGEKSLIYKSPPIIKILEQDVLVCYHIQANFMTDLKQKMFPIGDHKLTFILQNKSVTAHELFFITEQKNITLPDKMLVKTWLPKRTFASAGYIKAVLDPENPAMSITYPCVAFSIDFESVGARLPISLYLPLFILFFIMLISLILKISDSNRLSLASAGVPALVLFRLVIDSVSPHVGYITHIDMVYYLVVVLSLLILFMQTYVALDLQRREKLSTQEQQRQNQWLENLNAAMFVAILTTLVVFLTLYW